MPRKPSRPLCLSTVSLRNWNELRSTCIPWLLTDERCLREANAKSLTAELFTDWKQWAEAAGEFVGAQRRFSDLLITRGLQKWRNGMGVRGFQGIGLKRPPTPAYTPYADN